MTGFTEQVEKALFLRKFAVLSDEKVYIPVTVGDGCVLGTAVTYHADQEALEGAYCS